MHIIVAMVAVVVGLIFALNYISRNAGETADNVRTLANLPRRLRWQARQRQLSLRTLDDPREAAVTLLLGVARATGEVSSAQKQIITGFAEREFQATRTDAQDMVLLAGFMLRDTYDVGEELRAILAPILAKVGVEERQELSAAVHRIAKADGPPDPKVADLLAAIDQRLLPSVAADET
ncbi:MAG: TerB family tellurite resistance protein [Rhodospirillaceae bacterium]|nr:TerB family tellurite resistance protein [Rhodospirillaceae bacterium]